MMKLTKIAGLVLIAAAAVFCVLNFWNGELFRRAQGKNDDLPKKIRLLEKANRFYPWNFEVWQELGIAHFMSFQRLLQQMDKDLGEEHLKQSADAYRRSIRLNPTNALSHYYYAQTLSFLQTLASDTPDPIGEYTRAVLLAGHNSDIHYQAGLIFLGRWDSVSEEDRTFMAANLQRILAGPKRGRFETVLSTWQMAGLDTSVMRSILPRDPGLYRRYAQFLGERSLSLEERQWALAEAEAMTFAQAQQDVMDAHAEFESYRFPEAERGFNRALGWLRSIRFYRYPSGEAAAFSLEEYRALLSSVLLQLVKSKIEQGRALKETETELMDFIEQEPSVSAVTELRDFLVDRNAMEEKPGENFDDWNSLYFQILLLYRQNGYREIIRLGRVLKDALIVVSPLWKERYASVVHLIGEANLKGGYLYDAEEFFQRAMEQAPDRLETLIGLRDVYDRLNDTVKGKEVESRISALMTRGAVMTGPVAIGRQKPWSYTFLSDGTERRLSLRFVRTASRVKPLLSILFNGLLVMETFLDESSLSLSLPTQIGENELILELLNTSRSLQSVNLLN
ncbi:MAG: tetratricopeptide repeat protein [Candidatus Aminicenantes bacterium]|nr:tetratricopeptide repeat protein [Candidatus Aminicenantes bacterium]